MNYSNSSNATSTGSRGELSNLLFYGLVPVVISCIFYVIIAVFAIFGNALVVGSFIRHRHLRTYTNYFVASLAVADILVGLVSIPMWMTSLLGSPKDPSFYVVYTLLDIFSGTTSIIHLMVISLERFYAISFPVRHRNTSAAVYHVSLVFVWVWPAIMCGLTLKLREYDKELNILILFLAFFVIPLAVILFAYGGIWKAVRSRVLPQPAQPGKRSLKRDMRVIVTIALLILFFVIAWLPFFIVNLFAAFCFPCISAYTASLLLFVKFMHYSNSAVNPIVYAVKIPEFRRAFRQLVGLCMCRAENLRPRDHELFSGTDIRDKRVISNS
ncbi:hypothetical protein QZH41_001668 [Actinostola sp. cb2023]|nr:hypothetical protein QZH41_001668 [Actinostola sp. cb2023]